MKFDECEPFTVYRTSIDSSVQRVDFENSSNSKVYHDFKNYE
jgi:hypothetical protein